MDESHSNQKYILDNTKNKLGITDFSFTLALMMAYLTSQVASLR